MIEQWYAVHKKTGEFFCRKGRYCFSEKGLLQSIRNDLKWSRFSFVSDWEMRKVELT